jgi:hypothetical protein
MQETHTKVAEWINTLIDPAAQETA